MLNRVFTAFNEGFDDAPIALILLGMVIMLELGAWHTSNDLDHICQLLGDRDVEVPSPESTKEEIVQICFARRTEE